MIGTKLAHYEITAHLGSGGMGEVFQATDTKLGCSVAIKFLPEAFSHDTERVARTSIQGYRFETVSGSRCRPPNTPRSCSGGIPKIAASRAARSGRSL